MLQHAIVFSTANWSPDDALELMGFGPMHWLMFLGTGLVWGADACTVMLLSFVGPSARCEWQLDPWQESLLGSAVFAGQLAGASVWGALGDSIGRKRTIFWSCVMTAVCGFCSVLAPSYWWMLIARFVSGFAVSAAPAAFTWMLEWTPPRLRGRVMVMFSVWWTIGTVSQACLAWAVLNSKGWRLLVAASATPQLLFIALCPWLPESPHFLMAQTVAARSKATAAIVTAEIEQSDAAAIKKNTAQVDVMRYKAAAHAVLKRAADMAGVELPAGQLVPDAADEEAEELPDAADHQGSSGQATHNGDRDTAMAMADARQASAARPMGSYNHRKAASYQASGVPIEAAEVNEHLLVPTHTGNSGASSSHHHRHPAHPLLRPAMATLIFVWFVAAIAYYGIVMLAAELNMPSQQKNSANASPSGPPDTLLQPAATPRMTMQELTHSAAAQVVSATSQGSALRQLLVQEEPTPDFQPDIGHCTGPNRAISLPSSTYIGVITAALSEIPAMVYSVVVVGAGVNHAHRAMAVSATIGGTAAALLLDVVVRGERNFKVAPGWTHWLDTIALLISRCLICATYNLVYIYTPELLSTKVRVLGMGICNTISRLGGLAAPLLAVGLVEQGHERVSLSLLGALCSAAAVVMWVTPPHQTLAPQSHIQHGL